MESNKALPRLAVCFSPLIDNLRLEGAWHAYVPFTVTRRQSKHQAKNPTHQHIEACLAKSLWQAAL